MITGSITYDSIDFGKLRFDYVFPEDHNFTPELETGKFTIWTVKQVYRVDIPIERLTIQKMQDMRAQLLRSLDRNITSLNPPVNNLHENYMRLSNPAQTSPVALAQIREADRAQSDLKFLKSMLESWDYDENLRNGPSSNPAAA